MISSFAKFHRTTSALALALASLYACPAHACMLWATVESAGAGTIISKNRDWKPDHTQILKLKRDGKGFAYFGLYAEGNDSPGLKEGVNERGLCVVTATAGSIPKPTREAQKGTGGLMGTILANYASCDAVLADKEKLFRSRRPQFLMISDRHKIITLEVGLNGRYAVKVTEAGSVAHTNHFLESSMQDCNHKIGTSSATRFERISELLRTNPLTPATFAAMSKDQKAGPSDSLWRTAKDGATLSSWILETPAEGAPTLRVVIANPGQPEQTSVYRLDKDFWATKTGLPNTVASTPRS